MRFAPLPRTRPRGWVVLVALLAAGFAATVLVRVATDPAGAAMWAYCGDPSLAVRGGFHAAVPVRDAAEAARLDPPRFLLGIVRAAPRVLFGDASRGSTGGALREDAAASGDPARNTAAEEFPIAMLPSLSRDDELRLRLAAWIVAWNGPVSPLPLFARLDPAIAAHPAVRRLRGDAELEARRLEDAKRTYRELLVEAPRDAELLLRFAGVSALLEESEPFQQTMRALVEEEPGAVYRDAEWWLRRVAAHAEARDFAPCLAAAYLAASLAPDDPAVLKRFGGILLGLRRDHDAAEYLQRAIALAPDDAEARSLLEAAERDGP